jgi:hypothetical protein
VHEVRNALDMTVLKGQVYMDGIYLCNFIRLEYRASRLVEQARESNRFFRTRSSPGCVSCPKAARL